MEVESINKREWTWRDSRWLVFVEFALVVAVYVAREHHILKVSATARAGLQENQGGGRQAD